MAELEPIQNLIPNGDPQLADLLNLLKKDIFLSLNCHAIVKIAEFFPSEQTATATIEYKQTFFRQNSDGSYTPKLVDYPTLVKCPVFIYGGGGGALTFPIAAGDAAMVAFNDRDIDDWYAGKSAGPPPTNRLHSFSDAIIFVGLRPMQSAIEGYDTDRALLKYKNARVGVGKDDDLVLIANEDTTLFPLLEALINQIKNLVTATNDLVTQTAAITVTGVTPGGAPSGPPANAAAITAIATTLSTITSGLTTAATDLEGLLE